MVYIVRPPHITTGPTPFTVSTHHQLGTHNDDDDDDDDDDDVNNPLARTFPRRHHNISHGNKTHSLRTNGPTSFRTSKGHVTWIIKKFNKISTHCGVAYESVCSLARGHVIRWWCQQWLIFSLWRVNYITVWDNVTFYPSSLWSLNTESKTPGVKHTVKRLE